MGSLTVHVLNDDGNPVRGKRVFVSFGNTHSDDDTGSDGTVEFDDIPTGAVGVYVDGNLQVTVSVGQNGHEDVTVSL